MVLAAFLLISPVASLRDHAFPLPPVLLAVDALHKRVRAPPRGEGCRARAKQCCKLSLARAWVAHTRHTLMMFLQSIQEFKMVIAWIVICVGLLAVEMHHLAFFAMFGAAGAAAAALVAVVAPDLIPVQIAAATVVGAVGVVAVRPHMSKAVAHKVPGLGIAGVHGGLIGSNGVTTDEVGPHSSGHVRLLGETWLAISAYGDTLPPATPVAIVAVTGTTLTVRAVEEWELI